MISQTIAIIKKNIIRLVRSKTSALIIIFGPLLIIFLAGLAFDNARLYGIKIGIFSSEHDAITTAITDMLKSQKFTVKDYDAKEKCIDSIASGSSHICMLITQGKNGKKEISFAVDYSRLNLVYSLMNTINAGLASQSQNISMALTGEILQSLNQASSVINENKDTLRQFSQQMTAMQSQLGGISASLDQVDLSAPNISARPYIDKLSDSQTQISQFQQEASANIELYQTNLDSLDAQVTTFDEQMAQWTVQLNAIESNVSDAAKRLNCQPSSENIFRKDATSISDRIVNAANPTCLLLYSTLNELKQERQVLDSSANQITTIKSQVDDAQQSLDNASAHLEQISTDTTVSATQMQLGLESAQKSLDEAAARVAIAQQMKAEMKTQLDQINQVLATGSTQLGTMQNSIDTLSLGLDAAGNLSADNIIKPFKTSIQPLQKDKKLLDFLFPSLLTVIMTFTGILLASTLVLKEKTSPAYFRNFITPTKNILFIIGIYITALLIVIAQCVLLLGIGSVFFTLKIFENLSALIAILIAVGSLFILMGMIIGYIFKSEETATIAAISLSCIFFLFSSVIIPIENMQQGIGQIVRFSPFVVGENLIRQVTLFDNIGSGIASDIALIILYLILLFALTIGIQRLMKHYVEE